GAALMKTTSQHAVPQERLPDHTVEASSRSPDHDTVPGGELPAAVYISVFASFAWIVVASWIAFAHGADAELALGMAGVLTVVFFALPLLVWLMTKSRSLQSRDEAGDFLSSRVETATGPLTGASAWLQIALIPAALALAATLIGVTSMIV